MNRSEIRQGCRDLLNEATEGFWSDAQLNRYINLANTRLNSIIATTRQDYFTISATFSTVAGTKSYSFPTDCEFIRRMEIYNAADAGDIVKIDELTFPRMESNGDWPFTASGQPKRYIVRGIQFDLLPTPDAVYTVRLYYSKVQSALSLDVDIPISPASFHDMIIFYACALAKKQNEEDDDGFMGLFKIRKAELIQLLQGRGGDDPKTVEAYLEGII